MPPSCMASQQDLPQEDLPPVQALAIQGQQCRMGSSVVVFCASQTSLSGIERRR